MATREPRRARPATPADTGAIARTLGRAFRDDPVFSFLVPGLDDDERARRLAPFFVVETRLQLRDAAVWTSATPSGDIAAAAIWAPPGRWRTPPRDALRFLPPMVRATGVRRTVTGLASLSAMEKAHPGEPHWYLATLGTDPDHQGAGHATAAMAPVLDRCDTDEMAAYLESSKESNIAYYERHGFRVTGEIQLPRGGPRVWAMWRDPVPPRMRA